MSGRLKPLSLSEHSELIRPPLGATGLQTDSVERSVLRVWSGIDEGTETSHQATLLT